MSLADAILERLNGAVDPVYDGEVPLDDRGRPLVERYAVMYVATPVRDSLDLSRTTADRHTLRWQITSVGTDRTQAEWVAVRCRDAVLDWRPVAEGWELAPVEHLSSSPIRRDDDLPGAPLFNAVDTYSLIATR